MNWCGAAAAKWWWKLGVSRSFRQSESANRLVDSLHATNRVSQAGGLSPLYQTLIQGGIHAMFIEPFDFPALEENSGH